MNPLKKLRSFFKRSAPKKAAPAWRRHFAGASAEPIVKKVTKVRKVTKVTTVGAPPYFTQEKGRSIVEKLDAYMGIAVGDFTLEQSVLTIGFKREVKNYIATFSVASEAEKTTYELMGEITQGTKKLFTKRRSGLDYSQVEPALMFIFHQTFTNS